MDRYSLNDAGVLGFPAESSHSINLFVADSDDEDFEDPLSLRPPPPPATNSAGGGGFAAKLPRKDVLKPGSRPRLSQTPALRYKWSMTNHGWMGTEDECEVVENELATFVPGVQKWKPFNRQNGLTYKGDPTKVSKADIICPYNLECMCPFKMRRVRKVTEEGYVYCIEVGDQDHCDHNVQVERLPDRQRQHISLAIKFKMNSPSKLQQTPRNLVAGLEQGGFNLTQKNKAAVTDERRRLIM